MNKQEYENFIEELVNAEVVELHNFEKQEIFERLYANRNNGKKRNRYIKIWTSKTCRI